MEPPLSRDRSLHAVSRLLLAAVLLSELACIAVVLAIVL